MERQKTKWIRLNWRVLTVLALAILVALTSLLIFNRDRLSMDSINRAIHYRRLGTAAQTDQFQFLNSATNTFVTLGEGLAVASASGLSVYDRTGNVQYSAIFSMQRPVIRERGGFVLAYDMGGRAIQLGSSREALWRLDWEDPLIAVSVNENGWLAVACEQNGPRGAVTVVNAQGTPVWRWGSDRYVLGAVLASDNRTLAISTLTETGGEILWYSVTAVAEDEPQAVFSYRGEVFFDLWFSNRRNLAVLSANLFLYLSDSGEVLGEYHFFDRYLRAYDPGGDSVALYLSPHETGIGGNFVLVSNIGADREIEILGTPLDISLSGRYLAALFIDKLLLFRNGALYAEFQETEGMTRVLAREDGSVFRLSASRARLLIP